KFLDDLLPTDRVAVVSYDSHLKLRQDFTNDHERIRDALFDAIRTGEPAAISTAYFPSIAEHFDYAAAKDASTPERGLFVLARALAPIPGGKTMLFFGWGLSTVGGIRGPNPTEQRDYGNAMRALAAARTNTPSKSTCRTSPRRPAGPTRRRTNSPASRWTESAAPSPAATCSSSNPPPAPAATTRSTSSSSATRAPRSTRESTTTTDSR